MSHLRFKRRGATRRVALLLLVALVGLGLPMMAAAEEEARPRKVLFIGDSISIGYHTPAISLLGEGFECSRIAENGQSTAYAMKVIDEEKKTTVLDQWLLGANPDVIHFNFGLHDLKVDKDGKTVVSLEDYASQMDRIVERLKQTGATLVFATTTPVPEKNAYKRRESDVRAFNQKAVEVMNKHGVRVNDLHAAILPRQKELQKKDDVHFTEEGSKFLGKQVADAVRAVGN